MNEEDLMLSDDQDLEELLRQRLLAQQDQQQVGVGAGGAIGAGLAGFGSLLAGQNPLAATQSVLNSAQQLEQQRLRAKALENQATLGALRNISQERQRRDTMQNALERIKMQNELRQQEFDRRFPMESAERARRAGIMAQSAQDLAKIRGDIQSQIAERGFEFRGQESQADRELRERLETERLKAQAEQKEKDRAARALLEREKAAKKSTEKGAGKILPSDKALLISEGSAIPRTNEDVLKTITDNADVFGPVTGRMRALNPYDEQAATIDAQMRAASQSFGRYMESGVLRKEDEEKYRRMYPNLSDTPEVARNKLMVVDRLLKSKLNSDIEALQQAGYDVNNLMGRKMQVPGVPSKIRSQGKAGPDKQAVINELRRRGLVK